MIDLDKIGAVELVRGDGEPGYFLAFGEKPVLIGVDPSTYSSLLAEIRELRAKNAKYAPAIVGLIDSIRRNAPPVLAAAILADAKGVESVPAKPTDAVEEAREAFVEAVRSAMRDAYVSVTGIPSHPILTATGMDLIEAANQRLLAAERAKGGSDAG